MSDLRLYNTFTKQEELFVPLSPKEVTMYTCGPTVYGRPHIGNYSSFLMADLLRRWLEVGHGYTVKYAKNITDVGHLIADLEDGEDKIEKQAEREKTDPLDVAKRYTAEFLEDEKLLNIKEPTARPKATEYIHEMLGLIKILLEKKHAYETDDGIYFAVQTFPKYGKLSGNTLEALDSGNRIAVDESKHHPADFALWKKCVGNNARHMLRWSFETGERVATVGEDNTAGFPGWHIECSAMSAAILGEQIDIHTGGEDNIFPHHECEIAQSESVSGKPFVRHWLHKRRIDLAGEKMSKSLGNVLTIPSVIEKGYSPLDLRYYLISVHYRTNLKFSFEGLDSAKKERAKIIEWIREIEENAEEIQREKIDMHNVTAFIESADKDQILGLLRDALNADLNMPAARAAIFDAMSLYRREKKNLNHDQRQLFVYYTMAIKEIFGCFDEKIAEEIPSEIKILLDARAAARVNKNFSESDRLRDEIKKYGYEVRDEAKEQKVKKL